MPHDIQYSWSAPLHPFLAHYTILVITDTHLQKAERG